MRGPLVTVYCLNEGLMASTTGSPLSSRRGIRVLNKPVCYARKAVKAINNMDLLHMFIVI